MSGARLLEAVVLEAVEEYLGGYGVVAVALVGSSPWRSHRDVDFLVVVEGEPSEEALRSLYWGVKRACGWCRLIISTSQYTCAYSWGTPWSIHLMVYNIGYYESRVSPLLKRTWALYGSKLTGRHPRDLGGAKHVTPEVVLGDRYGVRECIKSIERGYIVTSHVLDEWSSKPTRRVIPLEGSVARWYARYCSHWSTYNTLASLGYEVNPYNQRRLYESARRILGLEPPGVPEAGLGASGSPGSQLEEAREYLARLESILGG